MNGLDNGAFGGGKRQFVEDDDDNAGDQTCSECGQSVRCGSGGFTNRVIDLSNYKTRRAMGKPFPLGDFMCADCEAELDGQPGKVLQFPQTGKRRV